MVQEVAYLQVTEEHLVMARLAEQAVFMDLVVVIFITAVVVAVEVQVLVVLMTQVREVLGH